MISADAALEAGTLAGQAHFEDARDTERFAMMFADSLATERERYTDALGRHDLAAAAESAAEQRDLTVLLAACTDHLRSVRYVRD
jgi:hypothetical protein